MGAAEAVTVLDPLRVVLEHLSGPDGNDQLYKIVGRALHRSSKQYQASARATVRHLSLDSYFSHTSYGRRQPAALWEALPWALLEGCTAVTSLCLAPQQLQPLADRRDEPAIKAMLAQLKHLKVADMPGCSSMCVAPKAVGQLLWACRQLEEVNLKTGYFYKEPWLALDPNSTSISTAVGPPLPLRSLKVRGVPQPLVAGWMEQQQRQLGRTLHRLEVHRCGEGGALDVGQLTGLVALRDLRLSGSHITASTQLGAMSNLTQLVLSGNGRTPAAVKAVSTLPNLQHLSLNDEGLGRLPGAMCALKHLTCLNISDTRIKQLPEDLGEWCPGLVRLEASDTHLAAVPASLGSLTLLDLGDSRAPQLVLPTTLTRLKALYLASAKYGAISGISSLVGLEQLDAMGFQGDLLGEQGMAELRPLTRLSHLSLPGASVQVPSSFTVIGTLQQLTSLSLSSVKQDDNGQLTTAGWASLARAEPLPALQHLDLSWCCPEHGLSVLAPWLSRLTALTQLSMAGNAGGDGGELLQLPPLLENLTLSSMGLQEVPPGLQEVPPGLQHLSVLQELTLSYNPGLCQLPSWFSRLCSLEGLMLTGTGVVSEQPVLAQMPALCFVFVPLQAAVCGAALPGVRVYRM
jgi:Leucine-rich repeat (LRR) protein